MSRLDPTQSFEALKAEVTRSISDQFPQEGRKNILELKGVEVVDNVSSDDVNDQADAKVSGRTFGVPVKATMVLKDKETGKVLDERTMKIAELPKITNRYSYVVKGSEYQVDNQWRLRPGAYTKVRQDGGLETFFNIEGRPLHMKFDPKSRKFNMKHGGAEPPLYPIMRAMGFDDAKLRKMWGAEILEANQVDTRGKPVKVERKAIEFAQRLDPQASVPDFATASDIIKSKLDASKLHPDSTKLTLGKPVSSITPEAMGLASGRLLGVARGEEKPDVRDSLRFKELHGVEDFIGERIDKNAKSIAGKIRNNLDRKTKIRDVVGMDIFNRPIKEFFAKSALASTTQQTNPLRMIGGQTRTTIMGEGGIQEASRVTEEAKLVDPSHFGVLDPLHTPESGKTGVSLQLALGAHKEGRSVKIPLINVKTGKPEYVDTSVVHDSVVALPDAVKKKNGKWVPKEGKTVRASVQDNEVRDVPISQVQYVVPKAAQMFALASNQVPFLSSDSPNRSTMAGRHQEQAIPLKENEAPLVRSMLGDMSFSEIVGQFASQHSPVSGEVIEVKDGEIKIKGKRGKIKTVQTYNHYPTNDKKGQIHSKAVVKPGDKVKAGDLLADTNFTRDGLYAPGRNLQVAYTPWAGLTYEDGTVISESASKKMTSTHLHKLSVNKRDATVEPKKRFQGLFGDIKETQVEGLNDDGVVRVGQKVKPGDVLIAASQDRKLTTEQQKLALIHKSIVSPKQNKSVTWEEDRPGTVVAVHKKGGKTEVHVEADEPMEVGDKLSNTHGGKGIVTAVLPDHEMPRNKEGKVVDVLMNPIGIAGRMNVGQVLETAAGKVARKTGKPYEVRNFENENNHEEVKKALKENGLSDTEDLIHPKTGKPIKNVLMGDQYIIKLEHQVGKKMAARDRGAYDHNLVPRGGGKEGAQAFGSLGLYAMLAHGARANLRESQTWLSDKSQGGVKDELWGALQSGELLPPPKTTFANEKFRGYLKVMGVNTEQDGNSLNLVPLTDKQVKEMSSGEITNGGRLVIMKKNEMTPEKGGIFDEKVTGGIEGKKWSHMKLTQRMPNPLFEKAIKSLTKIRGPEFGKLIDGELGVKNGEIVDPSTKGAVLGPAAVTELIKKVNVDKELKFEEARVGNLRQQLQDESRKRIKYLRALKKADLSPQEAYTTQYVPVLPPSMRPIALMEDGSIQNDDLNELYKGLALVDGQLKKFNNAAVQIPDSMKVEKAASVYDHLKALSGLGGTLNDKHPGIMHLLAGKKGPKSSFVQDSLIKRKRDLSARSTIVPDPTLSLDEVGVPVDMARKIYKPFVVRELRRDLNIGTLEAKQMVDEDDPTAKIALEKVVNDRPLLLKRDPALHKFGIQAFKPRLIKGKAIKIPPLVCSGFNADFDGDQMVNSVIAAISDDVYNADPVFWEERKVSARFGESIGFHGKSGALYLVNLEDFPHTSDKVTKDHIDFHGVPEGIRVVGMGPGGPELAEVSGWSLHRQREVEIVTLGSGRQIVTDDDERAVFGIDASSLEWCRRRPSESHDQFVPVLDRTPEMINHYSRVRLPEDRSHRLRDEAKLDFDFGYFIGCEVGDGWSTGEQVCQCGTDESVLSRWERSLPSMFCDPPATYEKEEMNGKFEGSGGCPTRVLSCAALARSLTRWIGTGSHNKHLPPFTWGAPEEFHAGLLSGLIDTDGSPSWSSAKKKPQFLLTYESVSIRLVQEIQHLFRMHGIAATITPTKTPKGEPAWMLNASIVDLHRSGFSRSIDLAAQHKKMNMDQFLSGPSPDDTMAYSRFRLVPIPSALADSLRRVVKDSVDHSLYVTLTKAVKRQYVSKSSARRILLKLEELDANCGHPFFERWVSLVEMKDVHFERVKGYERTGQKEDGYDLTVPGYETFMSTDGIILSNTMSAYVPVSEEARRETYDMMPSSNLFSPSSGKLAYAPSHEMQVGLFMATEVGKKTNKKFESLKDFKRAVAKGELEASDVASLGGVKTTLHRAELDAKLPPKMRGGALLTDLKYRLTKGDQGKLFEQMARAGEGKDVAASINKIKDLGNEVVTAKGFSFNLADFDPHDDIRAKAMQMAERKIGQVDRNSKEGEQKVVDAYEDAMDFMENSVQRRAQQLAEKSSLAKLQVAAGIKGNGYRQLTAAPGLFVDGTGEVVPNPVMRSYAEGLRSSDYWSSMSGGRKGIIQKVQSVSKPGYFTKMMTNSVIDTVVDTDDCGTDYGISLPVDDPDVNGRFLNSDVKLSNGKTIKAGTLVDPKITSMIRNDRKDAKVVVRSPMRCTHTNGICAKCIGLDEKGQLPAKGTNVGVLAAQALGERGTQMALKSFHSGGVYEGKGAVEKSIAAGGLDRALNLLYLPERVKGSATLAEGDGVVRDVKPDPAGGVNVDIEVVRGKNKTLKKSHYVPADRKLQVRKGMKVRSGDPISSGPVNPHQLLPLTGVSKVQGHLARELHDIYGTQGIKRRHSEVLVRAVTGVTKVQDPGDNSDLIHGDFATSMDVAAWNAKNKGKRPVLHTPVLRGVRQVPIDVSEDWLARMNHERLKETVIEGAQRGWSTDLHSRHPIPSLIHGVEFGKGTPEKPHLY